MTVRCLPPTLLHWATHPTHCLSTLQNQNAPLALQLERLPVARLRSTNAVSLTRALILAWLVSLQFPQQSLADQSVPVGPPLRNLDSHCPFQPPASLEAWQQRAEDLRLQLRVAVGLMPYPILDPVEPKIWGRREMDGYTVEKCTFESLPGLVVTGTLYRPASIPDNTKAPGVLCPHGHWQNGRFYEAKDVPNQLATGAERFESAAINPMQARCVQLARMGCIVYQYDMLGYADSRQISFFRAHGFAKQPEEDEPTDEGWLLYSALAESHAQSVMGLQTLATFRATDMLMTLPEVDSKRIGITGASGGGTQTFLAAALDPRISLAFPAVMVSTGMQGGCTCENCCLLRTGTGNVEMAALFAPKPLGLTAADDWTRTMPHDGFPQLQQLYGLYGKPNNVALFPSLHFGHNYNHVSRVAMYGWVSDHFGLGFDKPVLEKDFQRLNQEDLTVWDSQNPEPESGASFERKLLKMWAEVVEAQLRGLRDGDRQQNAQFLQTLRDGWRVVLGLTASSTLETEAAAIVPKTETTVGGIGIQVGDQPALYYVPIAEEQPLVRTDRLAAGYTFGYNPTQFARQAQRLGRALHELSLKHPNTSIAVSGQGSSAALAAAAAFCVQELHPPSDQAGSDQAGSRIELRLSGPEFRFGGTTSIRDPNFLPGSARYWDFPGLVMCLKQSVVWE